MILNDKQSQIIVEHYEVGTVKIRLYIFAGKGILYCLKWLEAERTHMARHFNCEADLNVP